MAELTLQAARRIHPGAVALGLLAIWSFFAAAGVIAGLGYAGWTLQTVSPQHSDLSIQISTTALFTGALMLCASGMAFALAVVDRSRRELKWRLAACGLLLLGLEEMLGIHTWLVSEDVSWALSYLPVLVPATLMLIPALGIYHRQRGPQVLFGCAIALWWVGALIDTPIVGGEGGAEVVWMASASLFALMTLVRLRYLASQYYPLNEGDTRLSIDQIAAEALAHIPVRKVAIGIGLIVTVFAVQYLLFHQPGYPHCPAVLDPCHARDASEIRILDINNEQTLQAAFQAALLLATGVLALLTSRLRATRAEMKGWWLTLGLVFVVLTCDQVLAVHSRFGDSTDLPGQLILFPVAIAGLAAWFKVLQELSANPLARTLFIAGAFFWALSQVSDVLLDPIESLSWTTLPEEVSETAGSALWLLSLLVWLRSVLPVTIMPVGRLDGPRTVEQLPSSEKRSPTVPTG